MVRGICSFIAMGMLIAAQLQAQTDRQGGGPAGTALVVVNLNTATVAELAALPGIGDKTAARIIEHRLKHGPFKKIEDLMNVPGIGEKSFLRLKPQLTVASKPDPAAGSRQP